MLQQNPRSQEMKTGQKEEVCLTAFQGPFDNLIAPGMEITEKCTFPNFFQTM